MHRNEVISKLFSTVYEKSVYEVHLNGTQRSMALFCIYLVNTKVQQINGNISHQN